MALIFMVGALHLTVEPEDPRPEQREAVHQLPEPPAGIAQADAPDLPEAANLPAQTLSEAKVGRVILDMSMGEFVIRPGPADEPIRVEADFDTSGFELSESFERSDEDGWTYEVRFGSRRGLLGMMLRGGGHNVDNRVELVIPRGHPIDVVGKIGLGESETDLGGLWIRNFDVKYGAGDHFVEIREPTPLPMESFRLDASVGEVEVRNLGHGSPRQVEVDQGIGELFLDLQGSWRQDADIDVDTGIGESRLWLPDDVHIDIERARVALGESDVEWPDPDGVPAGAPTLTISMTANIGEVRVEF